ncbi:MAG: hypothetical protein JXB35_03400 [Anaerolineae bacterium]|nr:hypothetical protein [Anaerolineae bacterium]
MNNDFLETQLWNWLLFESALPPQRAKRLLAMWSGAGETLIEVRDRLGQGLCPPGMTTEEATTLRFPEKPSPISALRWNDPHYPKGLHHLPERIRPALLFFRGNPALLQRPIVYILPPSGDDSMAAVQEECLSMLLGEDFLPAALEHSDAATQLLAELQDTEGEALLFVRHGLDWGRDTPLQGPENTAERILQISPLPPAATPNTKWNTVLEQVEAAIATHRLVLGGDELPETAKLLKTSPVIWITETKIGIQLPDHVTQTPDPASGILELLNTTPGLPHVQNEVILPQAALPDPPPPAEETLRILGKGGVIPDVLRERLLKSS